MNIPPYEPDPDFPCWTEDEHIAYHQDMAHEKARKAAPDLLAALDEMLKLSAYVGDRLPIKVAQPIFAKARAAVEKARS